MMTEEDYNYIKQYEKTYESAAKQNYAKILPRSVNEKLNKIIKGPEKKNWGCSACCMALYRQLYTVLQEEETARQEKQKKEVLDRMAKAREAKLNKNKQQTQEQEDAKEKEEPR